MIDFKDVELKDKDLIQSFTLKSWRKNCELSFVNIYSWMFEYHTHYAVVNDYLVLRFFYKDDLTYMMPIGNGNIKPILELMIADAKKNNRPFKLQGACKRLCGELEDAMPGEFRYSVNRKYSDYVYLRENLATLKGKKLQPKRNFVNRFIKNNPDFEYRNLTPELVPVCLELEKTWFDENTSPEEAEALKSERTALTCALNNMQALDLLGGVLFAGGKIVAFTYGGAINNETFDVCIEKADTSIEGSYAMINNQFAKHIPEQYIYMNREEDLEIAGLRHAKLSYQPELLLEKFNVEFK